MEREGEGQRALLSDLDLLKEKGCSGATQLKHYFHGREHVEGSVFSLILCAALELGVQATVPCTASEFAAAPAGAPLQELLTPLRGRYVPVACLLGGQEPRQCHHSWVIMQVLSCLRHAYHLLLESQGFLWKKTTPHDAHGLRCWLAGLQS